MLFVYNSEKNTNLKICLLYETFIVRKVYPLQTGFSYFLINVYYRSNQNIPWSPSTLLTIEGDLDSS